MVKKLEETSTAIVVKNDFGYELAQQVETVLDDYKAKKEAFELADKNFRTDLLDAMVKYKIISATVGKYNISQVIPNPVVSFDDEKFMLESPIELVALFSKTEDFKLFNVDKFREENPDIYNKYLEVETTATIDSKKLEKNFPEIFKKFSTEVASTRKVTLRIGEVKVKK